MALAIHVSSSGRVVNEYCYEIKLKTLYVGYIIMLILRIFKALMNLLSAIMLLSSVKSHSPIIDQYTYLPPSSVHFLFMFKTEEWRYLIRKDILLFVPLLTNMVLPVLLGITLLVTNTLPQYTSLLSFSSIVSSMYINV
jgi:hypothetical protein